MSATNINALAVLGAPPLDTLPEEWRRVVRDLDRTVMAQAQALHASETLIVRALALEPDAAMRLLRAGHEKIAEVLS